MLREAGFAFCRQDKNDSSHALHTMPKWLLDRYMTSAGRDVGTWELVKPIIN